jgi:hypothetical protein
MTEYAFILTGQFPNGHGFTTFTFSGTIQATPGMTRSAALADIKAAAKKKNGIGEDVHPNVMFFSLEPNLLGGA